MENLQSCIESLLSNDDDDDNNKKNRNKLYCLLSQTKIEEHEIDYFNEIIIPKLFTLINTKQIQKDLMYLSLIPNSDKLMLQLIIAYEKANVSLNLENPSSLFDFCLFTEKHWLLEIIQNQSVIPEDVFSKEVLSVINVLKLIDASNKAIIDFDNLQSCMQQVQFVHNTFVEFYIKELTSVLDIVDFCKKFLISPESGCLSEIYHYANNHSLLETFARFLDLKSNEACEEIITKLTQCGSQLELEIFTAYVVVFNILKCLETCKKICEQNFASDEITVIIKETEIKLLNLENIKLQVEILEVIFSLLFLQPNDLYQPELNDIDCNSSSFYCTENEVRLILTFLKTICDELKKKIVFNKTSEEFKKFTELNKHLADALWRFELITESKGTSSSKRKMSQNIISYMLAPPQSLIHLCLKQNQYDKALQVVQIYNLEDSEIYGEIDCNIKLLELKQQLKKNFKTRQIQKDKQLQLQSTKSCVDKFFQSRFFKFFQSNCDIDVNNSLTWYNIPENIKFMYVFDIAMTLPNTFEEFQELMDIATAYGSNSRFNTETFHFTKFYARFAEVVKKINCRYTVSPKEILCNSEFALEVDRYQKNETFNDELIKFYDSFVSQIKIEAVGKLNNKHVAHKTFLKLNEICSNFVWNPINENKDNVKYLLRLFKYLDAFSKILYVEHNNSDIISRGRDTSYFEILNFSRVDILEQLLFERKLDVTDFEQLFSKLKLDLVYHAAAIFFPKINLHSLQSQIPTTTFSPTANIISYIQKRNWLLAFLLQEMYKSKETELDVNTVRVQTFLNFLKTPRIQNLKPLYEENEVTTALHHQVNTELIKSYFEQNVVKPENEEAIHHSILSSQISSGSLETGEEIFEGDLKITNWKHLYDIINNVPENQLFENKELREMRDLVLNELVGDCFEIDYHKYVQYISNNRLRWECILNNLTTWPGQFCLDIIKSELSRFEPLEEEYSEKFASWYNKIEIYENIRIVLQLNSWFDVMLLCQRKPQEVLQSLLNTTKIEILLKFIAAHEINENDLRIIDETYFVSLFDLNTDISTIEALLQELPVNHVTIICYNLLKTVHKLEYLDFIVNFILKINPDDEDTFLKNIQISLKIFSCFDTYEQEQLWCLVADPMSIIEVLIMNTKLEKLAQVLEDIKPEIENCEFDENQISIEKIDETLRIYAEKSLEFRVVVQSNNTRRSRTPESSKLLQSLDSINLSTTKKNFIMPEIVPDKTQWIQNNEAVECMCCLDSIFSMFNRRHHCRRCGRVVCGTCSSKRMQVPTYGDILVRVCNDCYDQSRQDGTGTSSSRSEMSLKSHDYDYWLLTDDPNHNQIVREEFSYEYAPSVSLCLAILKCHSRNEEYAKFLLDQCDGMLRLLLPVNSGSVQEIDYMLVIKMLKSLAIAAKMLSAQCMLQWGTSLADRILSQADLLGLLAERGCLHLIPSSQSHNHYIDATTLRRLRDKLLELEQWNLGLEVSTKAGLDNSGVFAAWGKSCLKAGCLQLAREKFQRCFDKTGHYDNSTELSASFSSGHAPHQTHPKLLSPPENRPTKNPPLLNEIIHILESNTCIIDAKILQEAKSSRLMSSSTWSLSSSVNIPLQNDPAVCILNKLKNLSSIAAGNYRGISDGNESGKSLNLRPYIEPLFYEECIYYLTKYGTHMSLLEFYIKHGNLEQCLKHMLENRLSSEMFVEIYMLCLKENLTNALQNSMSKIDSTLDIWKNYLKHICRHLEKQSYLNSLYQLQQFIGDFVRAAMTCIRFYKDDSTTYSELITKTNYLHKAQQHLQQELEQEQWVEVASVRKTSFDSQESYEAKGIANPSLVMKMDSKNIDKHINTIWRQIEVTKFLAECEAAGTPILEILPEILPYINEDLPSNEKNKFRIPTLFGTYYERVQLAVLAIVCGTNVEDGFGIAFRIIHDYKLNAVKVYCQAGRQLAKTERYANIAQLVSCIRSSGVSDTAVTDICDEMLILAVQTLTKANLSGPHLDGLIKLITDKAAKIAAYIESKQLKSAYLLAVKHKRIVDIRRILREAEFLNQPTIKALCQKILHAHSHSPSQSKE